MVVLIVKIKAAFEDKKRFMKLAGELNLADSYLVSKKYSKIGEVIYGFIL